MEADRALLEVFDHKKVQHALAYSVAAKQKVKQHVCTSAEL